MNIRAMILSSALVLAAPLPARNKTDVIVMGNGDRLTGEIKGLDSGVLQIDLDYVDGKISVQWSKVARLESSQLFIVQTQDGSLYTGKIASVPSQVDKIQVAGITQAKMVIEQSRVVKLEETSETFFQRWSGAVNLGVVYSKGNNATQYNLGSEIEYQRERWGAQVALSSNLSANSGSETSTRNQMSFTGYRLLPWKNYFYGGLCDFQQSSVQGIDLQSTVGGGFGRYLMNTNRARISVLGGLAWQSANYKQSTSVVATQEVVGGLLSTNVKFFLFKKTNLTVSAILVPALSDRGRVRFNTNASYYLKLFSDLSWNFSFYGSWDTRPPVDFAGSDYGYSSGLKWTFGYR